MLSTPSPQTGSPLPYLPRPIATGSIALSPELELLTERLAENTHDLWSQQRLAEGWRWGPRRDDAQKTHPCLVPYAQLPEAEKAYDRATAMGTLKAILTLGFCIAKAGA